MSVDAALRAETDELIAYHSRISARLTAERTSLESKLIPVSAYIVVSAVECWFRHPDMMRAIDAAVFADVDAPCWGPASNR